MIHEVVYIDIFSAGVLHTLQLGSYRARSRVLHPFAPFSEVDRGSSRASHRISADVPGLLAFKRNDVTHTVRT